MAMPETPNPDSPRSFAGRCLRECAALTDALKATLRTERRALEQRDQNALDSALESKRDCIARLHEADPRKRLADQAGEGLPTPEGLEAHLRTLDQDGTLAGSWRALQALTLECKELNERNGLLSTRLRNRAEQTLLLLHAAAGEETPTPVYGPDGALSSTIGQLPRR
ncbi:MAG: flagellar protein FlgN [Pseudomonadota bacterium]